MSIVVDVGEALNMFREEQSLVEPMAGVEETIKACLAQSVSELVETIASLTESDLDDYYAYADYHVELNHPDPEDNLALELSEAMLKATLDHLTSAPNFDHAHPTDSYNLVAGRYVVIDTVL